MWAWRNGLENHTLGRLGLKHQKRRNGHCAQSACFVIQFSRDEGESFDRLMTLNEGFAAYSVAARLDGGGIGILAETSEKASNQGDPYGSIHFYRVKPDKD